MEDLQFKENLLSKIGDLTLLQKEHLAKFLQNPQEHTSTKEDIVVLSDLLFNIRKSKCYKNRKVRGSTESQVYKTYGINEAQIELDLYSHLKNFGIQLRKGGYMSPYAKMHELNLTPEELSVLDEIFPEPAASKNSVVIEYPELPIHELELKDLEACIRHNSMKAGLRPITGKKTKSLKNKKRS